MNVFDVMCEARIENEKNKKLVQFLLYEIDQNYTCRIESL